MEKTYHEDGDDSYSGSHHGEQSEAEEENQANFAQDIGAHLSQDLGSCLALEL